VSGAAIRGCEGREPPVIGRKTKQGIYEDAASCFELLIGTLICKDNEGLVIACEINETKRHDQPFNYHIF
jgi:hypothetical protein